LEQNSFSRQKQIDLLHILNYILHKKHYPQDICGIVEKKIKLLELQEQEATPADSNVHLSAKKGFKVNFIRVINCLFELSFFTDREGGYITKKQVFHIAGKAINQDLSDFQNNMNVSHQAANADMENTLVIFKDMFEKQTEINTNKTENKTKKSKNRMIHNY
jgi:hypothetical protein